MDLRNSWPELRAGRCGWPLPGAWHYRGTAAALSIKITTALDTASMRLNDWQRQSMAYQTYPKCRLCVVCALKRLSLSELPHSARGIYLDSPAIQALNGECMSLNCWGPAVRKGKADG
jgi:hypothetical protein